MSLCGDRLFRSGFLLKYIREVEQEEQDIRRNTQRALATKPLSRRKLKEQLRTHYLSADDIDAAMEQVTDDVERRNAMAVAEKVPHLLVVVNKSDLPRKLDIGALADRFDNVLSVSAKT